MSKEEKYKYFRDMCRNYVGNCEYCPFRGKRICVNDVKSLSEEEISGCVNILEEFIKSDRNKPRAQHSS